MSCAAGSRYRGVTVTDAIEAGALAAFGSFGQRAVLAARAGMDLLLCSAQNPAQGHAVVTALASALDSGPAEPDRLQRRRLSG